MRTPPPVVVAGERGVRGYALEVRREVRPRWTFRLSRRVGLDRVARIRGGVLHRLLHRGEDPVVIRVAQISADRVLFGAQADSRDVAEWGIERMRAAVGIDLDLQPFYERFRFDPLIGAAVRANPGLRPHGRAEPFEALAWTVSAQLTEHARAAPSQRRLGARLGRRCHRTGGRGWRSPSGRSRQDASSLRGRRTPRHRAR